MDVHFCEISEENPGHKSGSTESDSKMRIYQEVWWKSKVEKKEATPQLPPFLLHSRASRESKP